MKKRTLPSEVFKISLFLFLGLFIISCDDDEVAVIPEPTGTLVVTDQFLAENEDRVIIDEVSVGQDSWVVIREYNPQTGAAGPVVGSRLVTVPVSTDLAVDFDPAYTPVLGQYYVAVLHVDTGVEGTLEFTGSASPDQPVLNDVGGPVADAFRYTFPENAVVTSTTMTEVNGSGVTGIAYIYNGMDNVAWVVLSLAGTTAGVMHPAHIHSDVDGSIVYPLTSVDGDTGFSITSFTDVAYSELVGFNGYIDVHVSPDDLTVVSTGNLDED